MRKSELTRGKQRLLWEITGHQEEVNFENKAYNYSFDCRLILDNCDIKVKIAIPYNWEIELIDFYILDKEFPFIPHMESSGKLCLFELEGCLIDDDFEGVLYELIERAKQIILDGLNKRNFEDFIKEFYYTGCNKKNYVRQK